MLHVKNLSFVTRISFLLGLFFTMDKILAFVRAIIIAREFRLSAQLDAFNIAHNMPDLLFALISGGALAMAFIPSLTSTLTLQGRAATWALFSRVINLAFVATTLIGLVIMALALPIAQLIIAPGFSPAQQVLAPSLFQLTLLSTGIFSSTVLLIHGIQPHPH